MRVRPKTWFHVHSFTGILTGLLLFVICWSGTFATISNELDWLVTPAARVAPGADRLGPDPLIAAVRARWPEAEIGFIEAPRYARSAAQLVINLPEQSSLRVYVDPYTAEVQGSSSYFTLQRFFRSFHYALFFPGAWGLYLVSVFAVTLLVSLGAALLFYRRWWRRFLSLKRRPGPALWSDLHKVGGLWSLWFLLVIGLTGLWYGIEGVRLFHGDGKVAYVGGPDFAIHAVPAPASDPRLPLMTFGGLAERVAEVRPDIAIASMSIDTDGVFYAEGQAGSLLVRDRANKVYLDARTGEVLHNQRASDLPPYWRWSDTADPLHFGDFGGLATKLLWFAFGVALCLLILTGTYLHARRLAREAGGARGARWPGTLAACWASLAVLAASVPFGLREIRGYGPVIDGIARYPDVAPGVLAVLLGWIAATLLILAAWIALLWRSLAARGAHLAAPSGPPDALRDPVRTGSAKGRPSS